MLWWRSNDWLHSPFAFHYGVLTAPQSNFGTRSKIAKDDLHGE